MPGHRGRQQESRQSFWTGTHPDAPERVTPQWELDKEERIRVEELAASNRARQARARAPSTQANNTVAQTRAFQDGQEIAVPREGIMLAQQLQSVTNQGSIPPVSGLRLPSIKDSPEEQELLTEAYVAARMEAYKGRSSDDPLYEPADTSLGGPGQPVPIPRLYTDGPEAQDQDRYEAQVREEVAGEMDRERSAQEGITTRETKLEVVAQREAEQEAADATRADTLTLAERIITDRNRLTEVNSRVEALQDARYNFLQVYSTVRKGDDQLVFMDGHRRRMRNLDALLEEQEELTADQGFLGDENELNTILDELNLGYSVDNLTDEQVRQAVGMVSDVRDGTIAHPSPDGVMGDLQARSEALKFDAGLDGVAGSMLVQSLAPDGSETVNADYTQFTGSQDFISWNEWKWGAIPFRNDGKALLEDGKPNVTTVNGYVTNVIGSLPSLDRPVAIANLKMSMLEELRADVTTQDSEMWEDRGGSEGQFWTNIIEAIYASLSRSKDMSTEGAVDATSNLAGTILASFPAGDAG